MVATMNSIHTLLSENHPCALFMACLHPGYHALRSNSTLSHLLSITELEACSTYANANSGLTRCSVDIISDDAERLITSYYYWSTLEPWKPPLSRAVGVRGR